jgi:hypothetical protein
MCMMCARGSKKILVRYNPHLLSLVINPTPLHHSTHTYLIKDILEVPGRPRVGVDATDEHIIMSIGAVPIHTHQLINNLHKKARHETSSNGFSHFIPSS